MKIVDDNLVWMYEPSTTGTNKDVETIITGDTDSDYVKVVRCKDCKYKGGYKDGSVKWCDRIPNADFYVDDDFFCKNGERKDDDKV